MEQIKNNIVIIGAGPSGLYCADYLLEQGHKVDLYEKNTALAKKFLVAGSSGLNITHGEDPISFVKKYGKDEKVFTKLLEEFSVADLRHWCEMLGVETFVGSSKRVFPKTMSAAEMLKLWKDRLLKHENFNIHTEHELVDIENEKRVIFKTPHTTKHVRANAFILALGGASWASTGSTGDWVTYLEKHGVEIIPFRPCNCGFEVDWSDVFKSKVEHSPVKNITITHKNKTIRSECMLTIYGIEGTGIYALSTEMREEITKRGSAIITLDLIPDLNEEKIYEKLQKPRKKNSLTNHLRKCLNIDKNKLLLLQELLPKETLEDPYKLKSKIKNIKIDIQRTRPIDEAISTGGGISMETIDETFQLRSLPGFYVAGEMIDWEAPTGGYLLQGCFSIAHAVAKAVNQKLS